MHEKLPGINKLEGLEEPQQEHVLNQLAGHTHERYTTDIKLSEVLTLHGFAVHEHVLRPDMMTSLFLARHLHERSDLYDGKKVIDMGCGSGIQGVVMGFSGAKEVILADIDEEAVTNAQENVDRFELGDMAKVVRSDLFSDVNTKADVIVFNHPFFAAQPIKNIGVSRAMLDDGGLIRRFFNDAKSHLNKDGIIIMPYYLLAGHMNNPQLQAPSNGFAAVEAAREDVTTGLQQGSITITYLTLE